MQAEGTELAERVCRRELHPRCAAAHPPSPQVKVSSSKAIYRLAAVDVFRTDAKAFHVARTVSLPAARDPVMVGDAALPPLLVFNVQLPQYPAAFFGGSDGPGQSVVYYFVLPDDFDPARFENQAALGLLARFVANGREPDGSSTRERLKMIVRCCNSEEWAAAAPLTTTEYKLLVNYNEKPVLTRPQQHFFVGPNYLEVDMDVHSYAYLARKAFNSFHSRLKSVVWENAFVLQGNAAEELPEQVLGCGRIYRTDLEEARPLADFQPPGASALTSRAPSALATPAGPSGGGGGGGGVRAHPLAADAIAAVAAAEATAAQLAVAAEAGARAAAAAGPVAVAAQAGG
ncbi:MAG: hypothetical protein J3K34DRAFT_52796 [Monoraphidium minutum]|nr:MAG: hypothetical protein J3K34DRAFT_52796 [Monoraphidium minutum]